MERTDNYQVQAAQAKAQFLKYDQARLIQKLRLEADEQYLYTRLLGRPYRISRTTGDMAVQVDGLWRDANSHGQVMTLLDLICDSREDRFVSGKWKNMGAFGLMFHQSLLETNRDPLAQRFQEDPEGFRRACTALGGKKIAIGDIGYAIEVFDGLPLALQLWFGDEEFPASLRFLWDENALMYLKYETMYFARGLLLAQLREEMEK